MGTLGPLIYRQIYKICIAENICNGASGDAVLFEEGSRDSAFGVARKFLFWRCYQYCFVGAGAGVGADAGANSYSSLKQSRFS
jgi:hypothetical protein